MCVLGVVPFMYPSKERDVSKGCVSGCEPACVSVGGEGVGG